jgi:hypothetical protein
LSTPTTAATAWPKKAARGQPRPHVIGEGLWWTRAPRARPTDTLHMRAPQMHKVEESSGPFLLLNPLLILPHLKWNNTSSIFQNGAADQIYNKQLEIRPTENKRVQTKCLYICNKQQFIPYKYASRETSSNTWSYRLDNL